MAVKEADYAYAVARIRSNELKLLGAQDIDGLIAAGDCARTAARLSDKGWDSDGAAVDDGEMLRREGEKTWAFINEIAPDPAALDFLRIPNDFHNVKVALKAKLRSTEWKQLCLSPATVDIDLIGRAVDEKQFELLPAFLADSARDAYEALVSWADGQLCEVILDRAALETAIASAKGQGGLALELTELDAFAADIRMAVRCARMKKSRGFVSSALAACEALDIEALADAAVQSEEAVRELLSTFDRDAADALGQGLAAFERLCRNRRAALLQGHQYDILGIAPIICYILAREEEQRRVRIILAGQRNGVGSDRIRAML